MLNDKDRILIQRYSRELVTRDFDLKSKENKELHALREKLYETVSDLETKERKSDEQQQAIDGMLRFTGLINDEIDRRLLGDQAYLPNFGRAGTGHQALFTSGAKDWRSLFGREPRPVEGLDRFGDFLRAIHDNDVEILKRTMFGSSGQDGGFAIPEQMWAQMLNGSIETSVTMDAVTLLPMTSDTLYVPGWDSYDHTNGPIGAVQGQWLGEGDTASRVSPKLTLISYFAKKLAMYLAASSEVLQDSDALGQAIAPLLRNSLAFETDAVVLTGSGVGRPVGVLSCSAKVNVDRAVASNIGFSDITAMMGRILPNSLDKSIWVTSPAGFAELLSLETSAGSGQLVLQNGPGPAAAIPMTIFGRPLRVTEKLPGLGSEGDLMLLDLSYYGLGVREVGRMERTNAAQWLSDIVDFRLIMRMDGKPLISKPFTPAGGGDTLSPFVVLK